MSVLIWTTTPWTLPANLALAFSETLEYSVFRHGDELLIFHEHFLPHLKELAEKEGMSASFEKVAGFRGGVIEGLRARHPWVERDSLVVKADYVTLEQGTGVVHTAPGHGREDYETGLKYGLEVYSPIADDGKFTDDVAHFAGQFVFDADPNIIAHLRESGPPVRGGGLHPPLSARLAQPQADHLPGDAAVVHLDGARRFEEALACGDSKGRLGAALGRGAHLRHDREQAGLVHLAPALLGRAHRRLPLRGLRARDRGCGSGAPRGGLDGEGGADVWFEKEPGDLLPPGYECPECGGASFRKETDILDVWFDSGVSQAAVLEKREELTWPSDMYLEGSDQHRGWFHSSLLAAVGVRDAAPYREVLTHGYVVDGRGKKMSKSLGNTIAPEEIIKKYGAEILRLWVAGENYREDIRISPQILDRMAEAYRRIRNTCRFLLGNLRDYESFDPAQDAVPLTERMEIDRLIVSRLDKLVERVRQAYADYEFHAVYHALNNFCAVDLSSFYLDVLKDRLYISMPDDVDRVSGVSTMHDLLDALLRMMAPILPFTAEEAYQLTPKLHGESVHMASLPEADAARRDEALEEKWEPLMRARAEVLKALELVRQSQEKGKGSSLNFSVKLFAEDTMREKLGGPGTRDGRRVHRLGRRARRR